jgi:dextranase
MKTMKRSLWVLCIFLSFVACKKNYPKNNPIVTGESYGISMRTDKVSYQPGEAVTFTIDKTIPGAKIRYRHLDETISETDLSGTSWNWTPTATDYTGYLVDVFGEAEGTEKIYGSVAVDVSTDWARFPRYGFLSKFGQLSNADMDGVIDNLARHHINGIQFQDWHFKHHMLLAGTVASPQTTWKDIANRDNYLSTVKGYIGKAHALNVKTMFYNLGFGALSDAAADGVHEEWYVFKDNVHTSKDVHSLPKPPFKSDIFLLDPSNTSWQQYIGSRNNDVYQVFDFDGFHADQLGDRGNLYRYDGSPLNLANTFKPFLQAMKAASPNKRLLMNAVNQYGQQTGIAESPVDFLYTEVWGGNEGYKDLARIISDNNNYSNNAKNTVLAAYMNYNLANNPGFFNTPGVLLTDAVIFAFGGAHLELGEHMLGKEYFPNSNLQMKDDLKTALVKYYDFLVAYQNLLRDGGSFNSPVLSCSNGVMSLNNWPPANGKVAVAGKEFTNMQVLHLINLANAASFDWRDTNGNQPVPNTFQNAMLEFTTNKTVSKVWVASPDSRDGVATPIPFTQNGSIVTWKLPQLKYWDMIVVEY